MLKLRFKTEGLTLVELIVVIVILSILSTIAFLSFTSQSISARDSKRIYDIGNIAKGLSVNHAVSGRYPIPDDKFDILSSGNNKGFQGYAGETILRMIRMSSGGGKDPLESDTYYTYSANSNQNRFQLLGFLEDSHNGEFGLNPFKPKPEMIYADNSSYSGRYIYMKGDNLGIILMSGSLVPVQAISKTPIDLATTNQNLTIQFGSKSNISGTGAMLFSAAAVMDNAGSTQYFCDSPDIILSSGSIIQTWQACNIGSNKAGTGIASYGYHFQWGRNQPGYGKMIIGPIASDPGDNTFISNLTAPNDWLITKDDDLWGGSGTALNIGTYNSLSSNQKKKAQGPCKTGYHIPTINELQIAASSNEIGNDGVKMVNVLKIPYGGFRSYGDGAYYRNALNPTGALPAAYLASSTPAGTNNVYLLHLASNSPGLISFPSLTKAMTYGIRCIKD